MTDPKNTEDQELSLDQLKDAAGGLAQANQAPSLIGKTKGESIDPGGSPTFHRDNERSSGILTGDGLDT